MVKDVGLLEEFVQIADRAECVENLRPIRRRRGMKENISVTAAQI